MNHQQRPPTDTVPRAEHETSPQEAAPTTDGEETGELASGAAESTTGTESESPAGRQADGGSQKHPLLRWLLIGAVAVAGLAAAGIFGIPWLLRWLHTVSTDDAYVRGHVTYVAARIESRVDEVLLEDNDFAARGSVLVRLDAEPYRIAVRQKQAALDSAQAQLAQARAQIRTQVVEAWADRYAYLVAQENVRSQIAALKEAVANWRLRQADLAYAEKEYERFRKLAADNAVAQEELDARQDALKVAKQQVAANLETIHRIRSELGLPPEAEDLASVPEGLDRNFAQVRAALASWEVPLAQMGIAVDPAEATPDRLLSLLGAAAGATADRKAIDKLIDQAPAVMLARAEVAQAEHALAEAELQLDYTEIRAAIDGFVTGRSVNPGDVVQPGQKLLGMRPREVWVEANLKETQIDSVRIGHPVKLYVDAYPDRVFRGRVTGFSVATGASMSLLPPENATGNFVKVVQRLPVRIELLEPVSDDTPLLVGLSVVPVIDVTAKPTGPHAGERLRLPVGGRKDEG